jgi:hypothetical protein
MGRFGEEYAREQKEALERLSAKCKKFAEEHRAAEKISEVVNRNETSGRQTIHRLIGYKPFEQNGEECFGFYREIKDNGRYEIDRRLVVGTLKVDSAAKWLSEDFNMFQNALIPIAEKFGSIDKLFVVDIHAYVDYKSWQNPNDLPYTVESRIEGLRVHDEVAQNVISRLNM